MGKEQGSHRRGHKKRARNRGHNTLWLELLQEIANDLLGHPLSTHFQYTREVLRLSIRVLIERPSRDLGDLLTCHWTMAQFLTAGYRLDREGTYPSPFRRGQVPVRGATKAAFLGSFLPSPWPASRGAGTTEVTEQDRSRRNLIHSERQL